MLMGGWINIVSSANMIDVDGMKEREESSPNVTTIKDLKQNINQEEHSADNNLPDKYCSHRDILKHLDESFVDNEVYLNHAYTPCLDNLLSFHDFSRYPHSHLFETEKKALHNPNNLLGSYTNLSFHNHQNYFYPFEPNSSLCDPPKSLTSHDPIYIDSNADFSDGDDDGVSNPRAAGSESNPYIIENWNINASSLHGIYIENTDVYFIIRNCVIHDGRHTDYYDSYQGIYFYNVINGKIDNVTSYNNYYGVHLYSSSNNNTISDCTVYNNSDGIELSVSSNSQITRCTAYNNLYSGIRLYGSSNNQISICTIYNNSGSGICLECCSSNNISDCTVYNNSYGIKLYYPSNHEIHYNNIYNNTNYGFYNYNSEVEYQANATYNWWGSADGPSGAGPGSGDAMSSNVLYIPWLTASWEVPYPPYADFTYSPESPTTEDIIYFTDQSYDPDGTIMSWHWDFGDDTYSTETNPTHQYTLSGNYMITLTVTDDNGASDSIPKIIIVTVFPSHPPIYINDNSNFTSANGIVSGSGTAADPYIIENWDINADGAHGIHIESTDVYFIVRNCIIHDGFNTDYYDSYQGIYFYNVINSKIDNVTSYNNYDGIKLYYSSNNTIANCDVYNNSYCGIDLSRSSNNIVSNCIVYGNGNYYATNNYGIYLYFSSNNNTISNCTVYNNDHYGIYLEYSSKNNITNCYIYNHIYHGLYFISSSNNSVTNCTTYDNNDGIYLWHSSNNIITYNAGYGVYICYSSSYPSNYNIFHHNNFINAQNVYDPHTNYWDDGVGEGNYWGDYIGSDNNSDGIGDTAYSIPGGANQDNYPLIHPFDAIYNRDKGLYYRTIQKAINDATTGNTIEVANGIYYENIIINKTLTLIGENRDSTIIDGNGTGDVIHISADWVNVSGFTITNSGSDFIDAGIDLIEHSNNTLSNCNIVNNSKGISMPGWSSNNQIMNCTIFYNDDGIYIDTYSDGNKITNCDIANNQYGIHFMQTSRENQIVCCSISDNQYGIYLPGMSSDTNVIYHNNFINNTNNAYDECSNYWDNGTAGNYWSDYNGTDVNGDGIGDTPYSISGGSNQDNYPLMYPESSDWVIQGNETLWNQIIILNGNLTIKNGGNLTFHNVTLKMNCSFDGQYHIEVLNGGEMYVLNGSNITAVNTSNEFVFWVRAGAKFEMRSSELHECGWDTSNCGLTVEANNMIIANSTFSYNYNGISLHSSSNNTISNCTIYNNSGYGIFLYSSSNNNITNCTAYNNSYGIYLYHSDDNTITNYTIYNNSYDGNRLDYSSNNQITDCSVYNNSRYGIYFHYSSNNNITSNQIYSNSHHGICFDSYSNNNQITTCTVYNNSYDGILLWYSSENQIANCVVCNNLYFGIYLGYSSDNNITNNIFTNNGIYIWGSLDDCIQIIENNTVNGKPLYYFLNEDGTTLDNIEVGQLILVNCTNFNIKNLDISYTDVGIVLLYSSDDNITNCELYDNDYGIVLSSSSNNKLTACTVYNNSYDGIYLWYSSNNIITYCDITDNADYGVYIYYSSSYPSNYNIFHHNNFVDNGQNAYDIHTNYWDDDYPSGGNYWSDYTGGDLYSGENQDQEGSDGIGDTPYIISGNGNQDRYPLMCPWNSPNQLPTINITYPEEGQSVNGTVTISGEAGDSDGNVTAIYVKIDGGYWETASGTTSWTCSWNTTMVDNGLHMIYAMSYDGIGYSIIDSVTVYVDNIWPIHNVDKDTYYNTIQKAIDDADSGNRIEVSSGIYYESIVIDKAIELIGENIENTSICGSGDAVIEIDSNYVRVEKLCIDAGNSWAIGVTMVNSHNNIIIDCKICSSLVFGFGFYGYSYNNIITNCTISGNKQGGVFLVDYSSNNYIYHNNFINNTGSSYDECSNYWDYNAEGNYWSDFDEPSEGAYDNNTDGIVDTPYAIAGGSNQDNYPLMFPINRAPVLTNPLLDESFNEDCSLINVFNLNDYFSDPDGENLNYTVSGNNHVSVIINDNGTVDLQTSTNWYGNESITFRATDPHNEFAEDTIIVTVNPVNDVPVIVGILPNFDKDEDNPIWVLDLTNNKSDIDNSPSELVWSVSNWNTSLFNSITVVDNNITFDLKANAYGNNEITITLSDALLTDSQNIWINVTPINDQPVIEGLTDQPLTEDITFWYDITPYISDIDNDISDLVVSTNSSYIIVHSNNHTLEMTYPNGVIVDYVRITVSDGILSDYEDVVFTIAPVNDAPVISGVPDQFGVEDVAWTLDVTPYIDDIDNITEDLMITVNSSYVTVDSKILTFLYPNGITTDNVKITVSDGIATANQTITVTITPVNDAPTISGIPAQYATEDADLYLNVSSYVSDVDNSSDELTVSTNSSYATIDGFMITFNYPNGIVSENVRITVSDGINTSYQDIMVIVTPVNDAPVINSFTPMGDVIIDEGEQQTFTISASDVDNTDLTIQWYLDDNPVATGGTYIYTADYASAGTYTVKVVVSDDSLTDEKMWSLTVNDVKKEEKPALIPGYEAASLIAMIGVITLLRRRKN